jgi:predicted small lipoprotein YifL
MKTLTMLSLLAAAALLAGCGKKTEAPPAATNAAAPRYDSGNPLTAEDVAFSLQRAVILDKQPAFTCLEIDL